MNSSNSLLCCSGVMPMPVSATANSIQLRPSTTLRTRSVTSPCLVNLQALLNRLSRICRSRIGSTISGPRFSWHFDDEPVLVLLGKLARGADDLLDQRRQAHRFRTELELAGFDLRQVEHLVDEAEQMRAGTVHAAQRLRRLLGAEARRIGHHHLGEADDGVERRAQLVAHVGEELRLVLARHLELAALFLHLREQIARSGLPAPIARRRSAAGRRCALETRRAPCVAPPGRR